MYIIMGGTGHVGSATAQALLDRGCEVAIVTHDRSKASGLAAEGAGFLQADVNDSASLRDAFRQGKRALLLNPPADPSSDTDAEERRTVTNILTALEGSGLEKVVAASTYAAQTGDRIGDLNTLWELEQGLAQQAIPAAINRGAYYMSNWDALIDAVRNSGTLPTMFPRDLALPMVSPIDLGKAAAARLQSNEDDVGTIHVEGPARYTPEDVAAALEQVLSRPVTVAVTPRAQFSETFQTLGFSEVAAQSYARMTEVTIDTDMRQIEPDVRGTVTLQGHFDCTV